MILLKDVERVLDDLKTDDSFHEWCKDNLDGEDDLVKILEETKKRIVKLWS